MKVKHVKATDRSKGTKGRGVMMRVYYSTYHLWAAEHFSELARIIETRHTGRPHFDIKHRSYVTSTIILAVSFLEAAINELYQDVADSHGDYVKSLTLEAKKRIKGFWRLTEEKNKTMLSIIDKYQLALLLSENELFPFGRSPLQDVSLLIRLRNTLVHYKPETLARDIKHKFERQLSNKFPENGLMAGSNNPYFPDRCLGYGCAQWSFKCSKMFADEFFTRIRVKPKYQRTSFLRELEDNEKT